jgi:hypothetical protein
VSSKARGERTIAAVSGASSGTLMMPMLTPALSRVAAVTPQPSSSAPDRTLEVPEL